MSVLADESHVNDDVIIVGYPQLEIPLFPKPTEEELQHRRKAIARIRELRKRVGKLGVPPDDLVHEGRLDSDL